MKRVLLFIATAAALALAASAAAADADDALRAYHAGRLDVAAEAFSREAGNGNAMAQYWLAIMYLDGKWLRRDRDQALQWLNRAALQGFEPALRKLDDLGGDTPETPARP